MAACRPKLKTHPGAELFLSRFAEGEWREAVRPWLEAGRGTLERALVVVPTRGHAQALKQRCIEEGIPLLGVEFLTPSLARKKRGSPAGLGRNLQLLVVRHLIEARLAPLEPGDPARGLWKSLESDLEAALDDFEELVRGGFNASHFPKVELAQLFGAMKAWVEGHGYVLGPVQDGQDAVRDINEGLEPVASRLLILAGGPEGWPDYLGHMALIRRCGPARVVLAMPELLGRGESGETWVEFWERSLGVAAQSIGLADPEETCAPVAELWSGAGGSADRARVLVGATKADEMERVAAEVGRLVAGGAANVAIVFPAAGPSHARLLGLLDARGIAYADLIGSVGTPPAEVRIQAAVADFYERGCRLEELLALWPLLLGEGRTKVAMGGARRVCEWLFDETQAHAIEPHLSALDAAQDEDAREVARVARLLLPSWPDSLPPSEALDRFERACAALGATVPPGWPALREFAARTDEALPARALLGAIRSFLPEKGPVSTSRGRSAFARVTVTTSRRAAGAAWSDCILAGSNAGVWPARRESSCWLDDDARKALGAAAPGLILQTADDRALIERQLYCAVARNTRDGVIFSAALFDEEDPEMRLAPNPWLERVLSRMGCFAKGSVAGPFGSAAPGAAAALPGGGGGLEEWSRIWKGRRDPGLPFDEFFLGDPEGRFRPARLSALQIEKAVEDPARLWFGAVLGVRQVGWLPFARAREKAIGTLVHRALALAFGGPPSGAGFARMPPRAEVEERLGAEIGRARELRPRDRYWESFHLDAALAARQLVARVYELPKAAFCAAEVRIPDGATIPVGGGDRVAVSGKMDLVLTGSAGWLGAQVEIIDFKTGGDPPLSPRSMASKGASLQLGVYLQAARSMGAEGRVWMLKPEAGARSIGMDMVDAACALLPAIGDHLRTGLYGALTTDRTEFSQRFEWPLACAPIAEAVLRAKFAVTFGGAAETAEEGADE